MTKTNIIQVIKSVIAAGIGVQSNKNRETDFQQGSWPIYLIVGLIMTILFILTIVFVVSFVTS